MFLGHDNKFECEKNEIKFQEICKKLKNHPFESPWLPFVNGENKESDFDYEFQEFEYPNLLNHLNEENVDINSKEPKEIDFNEEKYVSLKSSLLSIQDTYQAENLSEINVISSLSLLQVPLFCKFFEKAFLNEASLAIFLNSILNLEKPLSITVAAALFNHLIFPLILTFKNSNFRNVSQAILNFFQIYPKVIISEMFVPLLQNNFLEAPLQEILLKLSKTKLSDELVTYCTKCILDKALPLDNSFVILQNLIEKKIPYDSNLHDAIAFTIQNWTSLSSKNMKFTKMLISILSNYGSELTSQHLQIYVETIKVNETIMKKAAESIIKKLGQTV